MAVIELARARALAESGRGREIRLRCRLSLRDVASDIDADIASVWRWENGRVRPRGEGGLRWARLILDLERSDVG